MAYLKLLPNLRFNEQGLPNPVRCAYCRKKQAYSIMLEPIDFRDSGQTCCEECWRAFKRANEEYVRALGLRNEEAILDFIRLHSRKKMDNFDVNNPLSPDNPYTVPQRELHV